MPNEDATITTRGRSPCTTRDVDTPLALSGAGSSHLLPRKVCLDRSVYLTKTGKTIGCLVWLLERAIVDGRPNRNYWWVAPIYAQAKIAFKRAKLGLTRNSYTVNESELTLTLPNGAVVWFKGAEKPDSLYGEDVYDAVIDEATRCREESWHAVRSTLTATRGAVRIIGNVKGRKNWAYLLARRAEAGEPGMHYTKLTAYHAVDAGVLDAAEVADAKRTLPADVFKELYLAEPSDDGGNPFSLTAIASCLAPLSTEPPAVWGWDLAKSVDWTVGVGLDLQGRVCALHRWQAPWRETLRDIRRWTGSTPALVDSTGVGDPIVEELQSGPGFYEGYHFTGPSKQKLMEGLAVGIQQQEVRFPDGPLRAELDAFEYEYTRTGVRYSAPPGQHDDTVCALALAWQHWQSHRNTAVQVSRAVDPQLYRSTRYASDDRRRSRF